jgi:hypothetical protein
MQPQMPHAFAFVDLSRGAVQRHDAGAAEAQIVLERMPCAVNLAFFSGTTHLMDQLVALSQAGRAKRVPLRQQPS